ncbi:hypothetical protein KY330_03130 [Candidatus Woesearchaeota archaeon]|nr:hypothetical protein [Candidatus Woesearchaeota archaeon]
MDITKLVIRLEKAKGREVKQKLDYRIRMDICSRIKSQIEAQGYSNLKLSEELFDTLGYMRVLSAYEYIGYVSRCCPFVFGHYRPQDNARSIDRLGIVLEYLGVKQDSILIQDLKLYETDFVYPPKRSVVEFMQVRKRRPCEKGKEIASLLFDYLKKESLTPQNAAEKIYDENCFARVPYVKEFLYFVLSGFPLGRSGRVINKVPFLQRLAFCYEKLGIDKRYAIIKKTKEYSDEFVFPLPKPKDDKVIMPYFSNLNPINTLFD